MKEVKKITSGLNVKLNKSSTVYYNIRGVIEIKKVKAGPH